MKDFHRLELGKFYHIYNRGNNRENIFIENRNYAYFLRLYTKYIPPVADTYAYSLMRNHFHILVRIKDESETPAHSTLSTVSFDPSRKFSNLFNAYAKSVNNAYHRTGALFQRPFGRIEITSESYFMRVILYIHLNPQRHGFVKHFELYLHSTYQMLLSDEPTFLRRKEVLDWFGSKESYIQAHQTYRDEKGLEQFIGGDD
jgi:REP element-mobilizing transposase RayT